MPPETAAGATSARSSLRRTVLVSGALLATAGCWIETSPPEEGGEEEGVDVAARAGELLGESARAWNAGDLEGFLTPYLDSPSTTYVGEGGLRRGTDSIRARFAPLFRPGAERDSLRFEKISVRRLGGNHALVTARWVLHREGRVSESGPFTLVLRRTDDGWRIVHDHSSSDPRPR